MTLLKGTPCSPGIARGKAVVFQNCATNGQQVSFSDALKAAKEEIDFLHEKAFRLAGKDEAAVFEAYRMLIEDEMLTGPIKQEIESGTDCIEAVTAVTSKMSERLLGSKSEYLRERAEDIRFVGKILCDALRGNDRFELPAGDEPIILLANELTPVDTMSLDTSRLAGIATVLGGTTSHVVLLAKSLGIPAVSGINELKEGPAFIDGFSGEVAINPNSDVAENYIKKIEAEARKKQVLEKSKKLPAITSDGKRISLCINIGTPGDIENADVSWIDGVGLFRTEFLFSSETKEPSEQEQTDSYKAVLSRFPDNSVTIRTLDAGGDKQISYLNMKQEENPFLGLRGIRLCLKNTDVFKKQLRAILIAAKDSGVRIMFPMITNTKELTEAKQIINKVKEELSAKNIPHCQNPLIGVMIETPAAAEISDLLAAEADFFSVGTNDLVQYLTAADRGNADVSEIYDHFHPAVERVLRRIADNAKHAGISVSICGDIASNPDFLPKLIKMGYSSFSVPLPTAASIKDIIRKTSYHGM